MLNQTCYLTEHDYVYYKNLVIYSAIGAASLIGLCIVRMICK
jgi:hypothetical protein